MTGSSTNRTIKSTIARLGPHAKPEQIMRALAEMDVDVSETHISKIKMQMLRGEAKAERHRLKKPVKDRRRKRPQQKKIPGRRG